MYNYRLYIESFFLEYNVYNIRIIMILNYIFIYQHSNLQGKKQFLFFLAFSGVAAGHGNYKSAGKVN